MNLNNTHIPVRPFLLVWMLTGILLVAFSFMVAIQALAPFWLFIPLLLLIVEAFEDNLEKATYLLSSLKENGIDINSITQQLEEDDLQKFNKAYDTLMNSLKSK